MITLAEIEAATDALSVSDQKKLLSHLAARLQAKGASHVDASAFPRDQRVDWMAEDEAAMRRFNPNE